LVASVALATQQMASDPSYTYRYDLTSGGHGLNASITNATGQTQVPLTFEFSNALVRSVSVEDAVGSGVSPMETISFSYQKVTWKSAAPDPVTGQITQSAHSWDIATNTGT